MENKSQTFFDKVNVNKSKIKELTQVYNDILINTGEYNDLKEQLIKIKSRIEQIKINAEIEMGRDYETLEGLKIEMRSDKQLLSDVAVSKLANGKEAKVEDSHGNVFIPVYNANYKSV